ncbi:hypothetical protein EGW08_014286 [Elysia chlorotica]|uniref:Ig-like domain-containing protein n=1 Tax=Elysia chlorotica TaxID=188477 RepID=A0A433T8V1_ELYCH|nr:hypothetical protein EGW08_014286 [Elysia chlorotica]
MCVTMKMWISLCLVIFLAHILSALTIMQPRMDTLRVNVTVKEKATAVLPCPIESLGEYKVIWTDEQATLLTHEDRRIIDDERISIERPYQFDWNLHIRDVRYSDQGIYRCQINTSPISIKIVNLFVEVPSEIVEHLTSTDVTAQEGDTVTLVCNATGIPPPKITWFSLPSGSDVRRQSELCKVSDSKPQLTHLYINVISCTVRMVFAPEIFLPNKRIGQKKGMETILECTVTAFPHAVSYWQKDGQKIITSRPKYRMDVYIEGDNRLTLSLRVFDINETDYGPYTCIAANKIGEDAETMFLYNYHKSSASSTTTRAPLLPPTSLSMVFPVTHRSMWTPDKKDGLSDFNTGDDLEEPVGQSEFGSRPEGHYATQHPRYTPQNSDRGRIMAGRNKERNSAATCSPRNIETLLFFIILYFL